MAEYTDTYDGQTTLRQYGQSLVCPLQTSNLVCPRNHILPDRGWSERGVWRNHWSSLRACFVWQVPGGTCCCLWQQTQAELSCACSCKEAATGRAAVSDSKTLLLDSQFGSERFDLVWDNLRARPIHIQKFDFPVCITWLTQIGTFDVDTTLTFGSGQYLWAWASEESGRINSSKRGKNKLDFLTKLARWTGMLLAETALNKVSFLFSTFLTETRFSWVLL